MDPNFNVLLHDPNDDDICNPHFLKKKSTNILVIVLPVVLGTVLIVVLVVVFYPKYDFPLLCLQYTKLTGTRFHRWLKVRRNISTREKEIDNL